VPGKIRSEAALVVLAGGSGTRLGAEVNKVYLPLAGRRVISWSFARARKVAEIGRFLLVVRPGDEALAASALAEDLPGLPVELVPGGDTRHESEQAALDRLVGPVAAGEIRVIAIHDGARPLAAADLFRSVVSTAAEVGGAVPAVPAGAVLPVQPGDPISANGRLVRVQTPQAFRAPELLAAYAAARAAGYQGTDTAGSVRAFSGLTVRAVAGSRWNIKITYPEDLAAAERLLSRLSP
jgi:2-C-methyl-D-erythritol 4-phosphate cytidylyltransferase